MKRMHAALLGSLSLVVMALPAQAATAAAPAKTVAAPAVDPAATAGLDRMAA